MRSNPLVFVLIFSAIILAIDAYSYRGVRKLTTNSTRTLKRVIWLLFWIVPVVLIAGVALFATVNIPPSDYLRYIHFISGTFILFYVPKMIFIAFNLLDDVIHLGRKVHRRMKAKKGEGAVQGEPISRSQFLTRAGLVLAAVPFFSIAYGIKWGRFNYTVRNHVMRFENLPASFDGVRIVQISDFHIGSFLDYIDEVEAAVEFVNAQHPDLLLFTGDFVNNVASEMDAFLPTLRKLRARMGKYSILGNHDYGEYVRWPSAEEKARNLHTLLGVQEGLGFRMLLNQHQRIDHGGESIELVGVENWGLPPFPQYGDLHKALDGVEPGAFTILLSHDPTHWDEKVMGKAAVDLTLSGHTHGAQFGIEIPGWRWSPVSMRYKRWGGMYQEGRQYLNVNTGIGFIGFPGRVGMPPEVTVIELRKTV